MEEKTFFNGEWKAVEKIGEGSFGTVYKAEKSQYGVKTYSAIKQILIPQSKKEYSTLKSEGMTKSDIIKSYDNQAKKWVDEIQFLNQFKDNENIVSIEDFQVLDREDTIGKIINIRMELLENIDDHVLEQTTTDKKVFKMALDILNALEDCEEKNVVHRDIKPDNVFRNSKGVYKLGDFGEAKSIEKTVSNMSKKGTENYMAPEIYKGKRGSRSVDTYSLGIMLYKYFNNNRLPFLPDFPEQITYEDREGALYKRMSGEEMKAPVKATSEISRIILKACSYEPKDRYKSAMDFREDVLKEYKKIKQPINLFDFQEDESQSKEENEYEKTVGIFTDNKKEKNESKTKEVENKLDNQADVEIYSTNVSEEDEDKYDKTVGIFTDDSDIKDDSLSTNSKKEQFGYNKVRNNTGKYLERSHKNNEKKESLQVELGSVSDKKLLFLPIGIETGKGVFTKLIEKSTKIPVSITKIFSTAVDNQTSLKIHVLQGESKETKDNRTLGVFEVDGIPKLKRGEAQIEVTFAVDENGMFSLSAKDGLSGKKLNVISDAIDNVYSELDKKNLNLENDKNNNINKTNYNSINTNYKQTEKKQFVEENEIEKLKRENPTTAKVWNFMNAVWIITFGMFGVGFLSEWPIADDISYLSTAVISFILIFVFIWIDNKIFISICKKGKKLW